MCMNVNCMCATLVNCSGCDSRTLYLFMQVSFDLSLARGLDYYTGLIFEATLLGKSAIYCSVKLYLSDRF